MGHPRWTEAQTEALRLRYPTTRNEVLSKELGRPIKAVIAMACKLRVTKTKDFVATERANNPAYQSDTYRRSLFHSQQIPHNKGGKMGEELRGKVSKTFFPKGHKPHNHKPVGSERINKDGYIEVKTAEPRRWEHKHRVVWEQKNGPVPPKHIVRFKDKNPTNIQLENLECVSMAQNAIDNHVVYPLEVAQVVRLTNKIQKLIKNRTHGDKKQNTRPPQPPV
jgi:hypothetical protein